jgi:hypothetical protein
VKYLIVILVIGLAIAPLLHFLPSKRQRALASLREQAAVAGLFVEFRDLPGADREYRRQPANIRQVIYYGVRLPPSRDDGPRSGSWRQRDQGWQPLDGAGVPAFALTEMPPGILAGSVDESSCGVYWREEGDATAVDEIIRLLGVWREEIVG